MYESAEEMAVAIGGVLRGAAAKAQCEAVLAQLRAKDTPCCLYSRGAAFATGGVDERGGGQGGALLRCGVAEGRGQA